MLVAHHRRVSQTGSTPTYASLLAAAVSAAMKSAGESESMPI